MSSPNESSPKKKLKKWQIALIVFFVPPILVALFVGSSSTTTPAPTPTPSKEAEKVAQFSAELTRWETLNPASGRAVFTIRNTSDIAGTPGSCYVEVKDESGTYKGFDWIILENNIEPGAKFMGNVILKVTKEGASFITKGNISCG
jgi:hypothetical protein